MMRSVSFGRWTVNCDAEVTKNAYAAIKIGAPEECPCDPCDNFVAQRSKAYPQTALDLFRSLGIEANREAEIYHMARLNSGKHLYGGWFHFVGEILSGEDAAVPVAENVWKPSLDSVTDDFSLGFTKKVGMVPKSFQGFQLVQLEFTAQLPWLLEKNEPR
jgi:hypothetical protein